MQWVVACEATGAETFNEEADIGTLAILGDLEIFIEIGALRDTKMPKEKVAATFDSECVLEGGGDPEAQ